MAKKAKETEEEQEFSEGAEQIQTSDGLTIEDLPGVGPKGAEKLRSAGYEDLMSIAADSAGDLMTACEIGAATAEKIIFAALQKLYIGFKNPVNET